MCACVNGVGAFWVAADNSDVGVKDAELQLYLYKTSPYNEATIFPESEHVNFKM